jgi:hypothetical protein
MLMESSIPTPPFPYTRYGDDKDVDEKIYPYSTTPIYQVWGWQGCGRYVLSLLHHSNLPGMGMTRMRMRLSIPTPPLPSTRYGDDKDVDERFYPYSITPIYQVWKWQGCGWDVDGKDVDETFYPDSITLIPSGMRMTRMCMRNWEVLSLSIPTPPL